MLRKGKRAIGYARVSAALQEDGTSLDTQTSAIISLAASMWYEVGPEDVLREVKTGITLDRLVLDKIRSMAAAGELSALFVYSTDRFSRDPVDLLVLIREFNARGVEVHFVRDPSDSSPYGELVKFILGFSSNQEHAKIRERTLNGRIAVARAGRVPTGSPYGIFGYDYDKATKSRVVNEEEAKVVKRIFKLYVDGRSMYGIGKKLNQEGVPTKRGVLWDGSGIRDVLSNTSYISLDYYGKTKEAVGADGKRKRVAAPREEWIEIRGYTPAIISEPIFQKAQERLEATQERFEGKNTRRHILTGIAVCGWCGTSISGNGGDEKNRYYRCNQRQQKYAGVPDPERCSAPGIGLDWLEDQVWSHVVAMVRDPSDIIADLELNVRTGGGEIGKEIERLRSEVRKSEQEEVRVFRQYRRGKVRQELLDAEMEQVLAMLEDLRHRLASLEEQRERDENAVAAGERIRDYCRVVSAGLEGLDADGKRALMLRLGVKVLAVKGDVMITADIDSGFMANEDTTWLNPCTRRRNALLPRAWALRSC